VTDTWTATLTADEWTTTVTAEAWTSNDFPGVEFVTQVVQSGAVTAGTGDGAATVDAVALTNFTVSTLTLSALNASISSTVAVNDTVLIAGGADAGTYTVTQSGAPCLTIIDPQPTTVRVNDVSAGAVWYVLVGTVWVPHATAQALAAATGAALGHMISAFIKVDGDTYGDPLLTPQIVHEDDPPVYIATFIESDDWEFVGLYDGHSPDYATPASLTLSARQPIVGDVYFTRGFYDISGLAPLAPPRETDVSTFRCGYISQNNGLNLPVQTLFIEKEQPGGGITNDATMIKIADPVALGLDVASTDVSLALEELAAGGGGGGSGDVVGPASSVDGRPALFDGTTGKLLKQASAALGTAAFTASTDYLGATAGAGGALSGNFPNPGLNEETVQDIVGAMFSGNTETGIAATYDDTNAKVDLAVSTQTVDVVSNVATSTILGRSTAGSGDSEELTAAQARTIIGIGTTVLAPTILANTTVGAGGTATLSVSGLAATGCTFFRCRLYGLVESTSIDRENIILRFNGDTGSTYTTSGGAAATSITIGELPASITNANRAGLIEFTIATRQGWWTMVSGEGATVRDTATVSRNNESFDAWSGSVSAALDSFSLAGTSDFAQYTRLLVEGIA